MCVQSSIPKSGDRWIEYSPLSFLVCFQIQQTYPDIFPYFSICLVSYCAKPWNNTNNNRKIQYLWYSLYGPQKSRAALIAPVIFNIHSTKNYFRLTKPANNFLGMCTHVLIYCDAFNKTLLQKCSSEVNLNVPAIADKLGVMCFLPSWSMLISLSSYLL